MFTQIHLMIVIWKLWLKSSILQGAIIRKHWYHNPSDNPKEKNPALQWQQIVKSKKSVARKIIEVKFSSLTSWLTLDNLNIQSFLMTWLVLMMTDLELRQDFFVIFSNNSILSSTKTLTHWIQPNKSIIHNIIKSVKKFGKNFLSCSFFIKRFTLFVLSIFQKKSLINNV